MITYTKIITTDERCPHCMGSSKRWEKTYHNQLQHIKCGYCQDGKQSHNKVEDVTNYVLAIVDQNANYHKKFEDQQKLIRELESKLMLSLDTIEQLKENHKSRKQMLDKTREKLRNLTGDGC